MKAYTDITILLDRSGSMETIKTSMESAYNEFIKAHKENPSTRITLIQFDSVDKHEIVYQDVPVTYADPLKIRPRGGTPLIDAFVQAIDSTGRRLSNKDSPDRPDQVLFVIITDGEENASRQFRRSDVEHRVRTQSDAYKWRFIYLGANQDAIREAASYGIARDYTMTFAANNYATQNALRSITSNSVAYASSAGAERGNDIPLRFTEEDRKKAKETK